MDRNIQAVQHGLPVSVLDAAHANEYFEQFVNATSLKNILGYYRGLIDCLHLRPNVFNLFYPKLKANLVSWRAKALLKKFDARASHKCYQKGKLAANTKVLVIGGGPCGMRTAIEAQLLGAKVVVVEKRDRFSRNNVLHLWPFVIEDLRMLGAKKFFGKFCAGAIDHVSIRQLQCILLKVALLLGVEVHTEVSFEALIEPNATDKIGWRAEFKPANHPVSQYEFDVVIGADGKRNTLQGFTRKEFRGKLAIAITANFINRKTEAEARVEEISGVAFIFNQKFFKDLQEATRIDLENIVYYKDDTHYFVMTAKKHSLIEKGVIKQDYADTEKLLAPENVDKEALQQYAIEAASFSTNYQLPNLEFAVNHYGQPDIAMFDFTSMYAAENASKVVERNGYKLLKILVGDSLLEPFWPTGSGCARGFLSSLDAAWAIRSWALGNYSPLEVMAERESIYRLLAQTTPDNLNKDWKSYTLDPSTRYPNLNKGVVLPNQVICLYDTDNPAGIDKMKRTSNDKPAEIPKKRRRGIVDNEVLLNWLTEQLKDTEDVNTNDLEMIFRDGKVLCAIIHHYRPDLIDFGAIANNDPAKNNQIAIDVLEKELGVPPVMTGAELTVTEDYLTMASYLTEVYDCFRGEIPHVKHPKLNCHRNNRSMSPITCIKCCCTPFNSTKKRSPCKKCFLAYHSEVKTTNNFRKKCVALSQQNFSVVSITESHKSGHPDVLRNDLIMKKSTHKTKRKRKTKKKKCVKGASSSSDGQVENRERRKRDIKSKINNSTKKRSNEDKLIYYREKEFRKVLEHILFKRKLFYFENTVFGNKIEFFNTINDDNGHISSKIDNKEEIIKKSFDKIDKNEETVTDVDDIKNEMITKEKITVSKKTVEDIDKNNLETDDELIKTEDGVTTVRNVDTSEKKKLDKNISTDIVIPIGFKLEENEENPPSNVIFDNEIEISKNESPGCQPKSNKRLKIRVYEKIDNKLTVQTIEYIEPVDFLSISSKIEINNYTEKLCHSKKVLSDENLLRANDIFVPPRISNMKSRCRDFDGHEENRKCHIKSECRRKKFLSKIMIDGNGMSNQIYSRVSHWITSNDFLSQENIRADTDAETVVSNGKVTDITSVSKMDQYQGIVVEERTDVVNFVGGKLTKTSEENFAEKMKNLNNKSVRTLSKFSQYSPFQHPPALKSISAPPKQFSVIVEGEETAIGDNCELPIETNKKSELSFKTIKTSIAPVTILPNRPSSRHKHKHADQSTQKANSIDRKPRKRRTLEKVGANVEERQKMLEEIAANRMERQHKRRIQRKLQTEQFLKSMQMLRANAKPDSQPFEDYSIFLYRQTAPKFQDRVKDLEKQFTYVPDHENKPSQLSSRSGGKDEDIAAKIKNLESKWRQPQPVEKKPKDLLRAIGKIETSDWNIKEIEKKIMENKMGKPSKAIDKEKVPKWSKEQFLARQTKMEKKHLDRQNSEEAKFADIDRSIRNLDQKLKEGTVRELGQKKVATIAEKLVKNIPAEAKPPERTNRQLILPTQNASQFCHFCNKRVYLMERLSAEGKFFHHGCFKCQYCHVQLRLGSYTFDRDGLYGYRFFCLQHFGMMGEIPTARVTRKPSTKRTERSSPDKKSLSGIAGVDLLDKVQTPERIEFSNLSSGHVSSDQEDSLNQIDEDEWTDKNFGASCAELDDTEDDSSSISDTDSDDEAYDDALEQPPTKEGTLRWAERWKNSYRRRRHSESDEYSSSDQSSYYDSSDVIKKLMGLTPFMRLRLLRRDESETATEGEEEIRARELRKKEVCVEPPIVHTDTGTDTEIVSDESSSETSSEIQNSATEISTDSEFAQDEPTPTRELPSILLNDFHVNKTRGGGNLPKKIQVTSRYLQKPSDGGKAKKSNIELKLSPLVPPPAQPVKKPAPVSLTRPEGYSLNRTQSTGGIAAKVSLELKKKYLLGETSPGSIQKSGSASTLDTKFKSFHTNITDCQKMLKPSPEISASMQTFCKKLNELKSPVLSPQPSIIFTKELDNEEKKEEEKAEIEEPVFENVSEGRPRSPLHETSIIVPQIDWGKQNNSLTSDSLVSSDSEKEEPSSKSKLFQNIPRVEVHTVADDEEIVPDSLVCINPSLESTKSIINDKKTLNQPKILPNLENLLPEIHNSLHIKYKSVEKETPEVAVNSSGFSSPESVAEQLTTALTETELSDWARDEVVSDDFEDGEFEIHIKYTDDSKSAKKADLLEFDDSISSKKEIGNVTETKNNILSVNLDQIEFMDTGTETSTEDGVVNNRNGYVLFKNEEDFAEDSLNPNINDIVEAINNVKIEENVKQSETEPIKSINNEIEEENSVQIIESGTTTEENTFTESTVKNKLIEENIDNNVEFHEHCQRLQSKIEFSNVKDSIDVRKSRRKSKSDVLQKPDLITEEIQITTPSPNKISLPHTPDILYNKEVIKKERDTNQKLIQEMVMNKMKAENKSLERKKRNKTSPFELTKTDKKITTPDVLLSTNYPLQNTKIEFSIPKSHNSDQFLLSSPMKTDTTPKAPPRYNKSTEEVNRKLEKLKQTVKARNKENNQPNNVSFRRCFSGNYEFSDPISNDNSLSSRAKSIPDFPRQITTVESIKSDPSERIKVYKSDPNILETNVGKSKNKGKDRERRKSITRLIADFFTRKSPISTGSKGLFGKLSPKSKETSKDLVIRDIPQRKCLSESFIDRNTTPPPVPPLPTNYVRKTDDSSEGEEHKKPNHSSCDTLDLTGVSAGSTSGRRSSRSRRISRQAQLKRHRMAQEIQRKLEETEVKMKELEDRGVTVEKALRGESIGDTSKDEAELLQEWFDLMRDRTELRRYERELTVRAQELELEDRHSRLQHELRERIENDKPKTKEDVEVEESIINEMIRIVEKRDSLIAEIEEDRLRCLSDINQSQNQYIKRLISSACLVLLLSYLFWVFILLLLD
ncbi:F-actin-monooxygenase Mical isoform X5 [Diorhabda carinulata]|uniref:F-actin-monooxygenase Mical isoform X5 n=1 Tax=Diorhabda carinulata TaxID=1163345 RepID=UPI0025A1764A|nr:F-actin-monooxygenase Mical isoform X5 [Diorhabda carinulata]